MTLWKRLNNWGRADQGLPGAGFRRKGLTRKRHTGTLGNDGNALYLDCSGRYMTIPICQNP